MTEKERLTKHMMYLKDVMDDSICTQNTEYMKAVLSMFVHYTRKLLEELKEEENEPQKTNESQ